MTDPQAAALAALEPLVEQAALLIRAEYERELCTMNGDACFEQPAARAALLSAPIVELVRGLMEERDELRRWGEGWETACAKAVASRDAAEASLSALRERVAAKDAALKRIEPYADLDDLPIIKAALCDTGPSTDWPSIVRQLLSYCCSILNDYPDKSPDSPLGILVREIDEKLAAFDTPASPDAKVAE